MKRYPLTSLNDSRECILKIKVAFVAAALRVLNETPRRQLACLRSYSNMVWQVSTCAIANSSRMKIYGSE
jgi:hypothetical protein